MRIRVVLLAFLLACAGPTPTAYPPISIPTGHDIRINTPRLSTTRASRSRPRPSPIPTLTDSKVLTVAPRRIVPRNELQRIALAAANHYHIDPVTFFSVIKCESGWDPDAYNDDGCEGYGCAGLTQQHQKYWKDRARRAGFPGASVFDPKANLYVGAAVAAGGWHHYSDCL